MKAFIFGLILGAGLCAAALWYFNNSTIRVDVGHTQADAKAAASNTADYVHEKMDSLNLNSTNIKEELSRTGAIIRRKASAAGAAIADAAGDDKITVAIKAKLVTDPNLSALSISVSTTDGLVTMSGTATSPENVQKAIQLAWNTDGVKGVVSTIGVKD